MMAADVKGSADKFEAGIPKPLFDVHLGGQAQEFDVAKDGRFPIPTAVERSGNPPLTVGARLCPGAKTVCGGVPTGLLPQCASDG
jgi:hypothetical protein